jgi:hypothetical protein
MKMAKEHFNFDAFFNKIDTALSLAQRTVVLSNKNDAEQASKAAQSTLRKLREIREMIDEPLVWFKMEKGLTYRKDPGKKWHYIG